MTAPLAFSKADVESMADLANCRNVVIEVTRGGTAIRIEPTNTVAEKAVVKLWWLSCQKNCPKPPY